MYSISGIIEDFLSVQGESPFAGRLAYFIRFAKCNRKCPFCDTMQKMKNIEPYEKKIQEILNTMIYYGCKLLIITGGEPLLYPNEIRKICEFFQSYEIDIQIETNGDFLTRFFTIKQEDMPPIQINFLELWLSFPNLIVVWSPKLYTEKDLQQHVNTFAQIYRYKDLLDNLYIKPVVEPSNKKIVTSFLNCIRRWSDFDSSTHVYLMPVGKTNEELSKNFPIAFEIAKMLGVNISPRLQVQYSCL